jgi:rod shape-determining protein MreC
VAQPSVSRRARDVVIVTALLAIAWLVYRAGTRAPEELTWAERLVLRVSSPVQGVLSTLGGGVGQLWNRYVALVGVAEENQRLVTENGELRSELGQLRGLADRGRELEKLLGLRESVRTETVAARIIGAETSSMYRVVRVRLDRGEQDVRPGMAVLAPGGVVGRIHRVFGGYSDVLLLTDPQSAVDVVDARTGARGIVRGLPGEERFRLCIDYLLREDEVREGDAIVTTGVGGLPRAFPVGQVVKVTRREFGLYQEAEVEPAVDVGRLRDVLVVVAPLPPPAPSSGKEGAREPGRDGGRDRR